MSPKLPVVKAREVVRVAEKLGFVFNRQKGSHAVYIRQEDNVRVVIPITMEKISNPKPLLESSKIWA